MKNNRIKIFVSHRIDLNSVVVENDVYQPVRCGACFDPEYVGSILGDNTGENISEMRMKVGEFTVQYWAWKNYDADYYGLCHYRRYLSFADKKYPTDEKNQVIEKYLDNETIKKYRFNDTDYIQGFISKYDAVVSEYATTDEMYTPKGPRKTVYGHLSANDGYLINEEDIELFLETLDRLYPEVGACAHQYFEGNLFRGYNCFILKKDLFFQLCEMEVATLKSMRESGRICFDYRTDIQSRTYGFFTEWLYGSFLYYLETCTDRKIKAVQMVYFENTEIPKSLAPIPNHIPVAYLVNRNLLPVTLVSIHSLIDSRSRDSKLDIILLHEELDADEQQEVKNFFLDIPEVSIRFIHFRKNMPSASNGLHWERIDNIPYVALFLPWLFPEYSRMIFLHTDTLIKTDLNDLHRINLADNFLAAPLDYIRISENNANRDIREIRRYKLGMEDPYSFVSTSAMLMDFRKIREAFSFDLIMRYASGSYYFCDCINHLFSGRVQLLDASWNVCPPASDAVKLLCRYLPKFLSDACKKVSNEPRIIHYQCMPKPWHTPFRPKSADFWMLARTSPMYERLLMHAVSPICNPGGGMVSTPAGHSFPRRLADKLLPYGSGRRNLAKKIFPKGSHRWNFIKKVYYFLKGLVNT